LEILFATSPDVEGAIYLQFFRILSFSIYDQLTERPMLEPKLEIAGDIKLVWPPLAWHVRIDGLAIVHALNIHCPSWLVLAIKGEHNLNKEQDASPLSATRWRS
jgi:hypothetical protein